MTTLRETPGAEVAPRRASRPLAVVLRVIAFFQIVLGIAFGAFPAAAASMFGLAAAPGWTSWLFAMMGARFLGYGVGMLAAVRDPVRHRLWIDTMIVVQVIDWVATAAYLVHGDVTLSQVSTAAFLPVLFVAGLLAWRPRGTCRSAVE